ncbi:MAG TPA: hypothetical protein VIM73_22620 [Polyangiaceae bacterium]
MKLLVGSFLSAAIVTAGGIVSAQPPPASSAPEQSDAPQSAPPSAPPEDPEPPVPSGPPPPLTHGPNDAPPAYYVEPASRGQVAEPPLPGQVPPGGLIWEPPPPPETRHVAPKTSLWLGARAGWFMPFGYVYARAVEIAPNVYESQRVSWSDYAASGPLLELNVGARLARNYAVFALWERGQLSTGDARPEVFGSRGAQKNAETDFWGLGVRASSDADEIGFLSEIALGYRRARTRWEDGSELQLSSGLLEARLGLGADIRFNEFFALSPLLTFGVGTFSDVVIVEPDGSESDQLTRLDDLDGHGWISLQLGAHFDLLRSKK